MTQDGAPQAQSTLEQLLAVLREGKDAHLRERKSKIQHEFMIARRMIEDSC